MKTMFGNASTDAQGRERKAHGSFLFPAASYITRESVPWHWHEEIEMVLVKSGSIQAAAGRKKYMLKAGEGLFVNAGILHGYRNPERKRFRFYTVVFHPRLVAGGMESVFSQDYVQPLLSNPLLRSLHLERETPWMQEALDSIESAWTACKEARPGYAFEVRAALSRIVFLLTAHSPAEGEGPTEKNLRDGARIKTMLQYIQQHYMEELNVAQIAASAALSESECLRCFHGVLGVTPIQYVRQIRIHKAAELLRDSREKIADIGAACGFHEMSYFAKTFRELRGCTPSEYRRAKAEEDGAGTEA